MANETGEEKGVIVRAGRDKAGRFLPGASGNPEGGRRNRKEATRQVLDDIAANVDPTLISDTILFLLYHPSWRAKEAGAKLYLDNMVGLPTQRQPEAEEVYVKLLDNLRQTIRLKAQVKEPVKERVYAEVEQE